MKLPCENCIKADVCKIKNQGVIWLQNLSLTKHYQELEENNIKVYVACKSFCERSKK